MKNCKNTVFLDALSKIFKFYLKKLLNLFGIIAILEEKKVKKKKTNFYLKKNYI
jgi:hypothetical protein